MLLDADPEGRDAPLPKSEARLVALSSAIAAGDPDPIATSVKMALRGGAAREEVYEALLQSYLFLGFPRARVRNRSRSALPRRGRARGRKRFESPAWGLKMLAGGFVKGHRLRNDYIVL